MKLWLLSIIVSLLIPYSQASERIITLGGDITEIIFALNEGKQVIARDSSSRQPDSVLKLPDVGYMRMLNAEGILSLQPTLILASEQAKPELALKQIQRTGVKIIKVTGAPTLAAIPEKIRTIAKTIKQTQKGEALINKLNEQLSLINTAPIQQKILFIFSHNGTVPLVAGQRTAADSIISTVGAQNALQGFNGYLPLSQEAIIASQPDWILITIEGIRSLGGIEKIWRLPGINMTPAGKNQALLIVNDLGLLGFGLSTPSVMKQIRDTLEKTNKKTNK
ncbi:heme/hemin ABC transporter substrate-binding protein [Arsenophonus apicola]|uniref:Hemin ABC transporter substrate-binding protein n=1 Tax=Arsenophonus apicola TaxID=2879119 RepID=A0ABY8P6G3_9GAMM|nr:hemin ABC transporter substrate-binding protein [Arsenophonus apicola]WGO84764.1 hemin ABC transporter substrate-binding protein [Arsenophonus apicola]